jgi:hypothetical protein
LPPTAFGTSVMSSRVLPLPRLMSLLHFMMSLLSLMSLYVSLCPLPLTARLSWSSAASPQWCLSLLTCNLHIFLRLLLPPIASGTPKVASGHFFCESCCFHILSCRFYI